MKPINFLYNLKLNSIRELDNHIGNNVYYNVNDVMYNKIRQPLDTITNAIETKDKINANTQIQ